jgi:CRP-like cAMP-binding protein
MSGEPVRAATANTTSDARGVRERPRFARVLEEDPSLGEGLAATQLAEATQVARAAVLRLSPGVWQPERWPTPIRDGFGLLVLDGLLLRRVRLGDRFGVELLSSGDLLRPWQREDAVSSMPRHLGWEVVEPCRLAVLDIDFARRASPFPQIPAALIARAISRSRHFAVNMAIVQQPKVETRMHMLLWHLADRWGTVTRDGVCVPVRLTQTVLAALVAAQRPTVSAALAALERHGRVTRTNRGWLLHGPPPGELELGPEPIGPRQTREARDGQLLDPSGRGPGLVDSEDSGEALRPSRRATTPVMNR